MSSQDEFTKLYALLSNAVIRNKHTVPSTVTVDVLEPAIEEPVIEEPVIQEPAIVESVLESAMPPNTFTVDSEVIQLHPFSPPKKGRRPKKQKK